MKDILSSLFDCAMRDGDQKSLTRDEFLNYQKTIELEEKLKKQLTQLLDEESLRLFELYLSSSESVNCFADSSSFRSGLAIGLKLAVFCMLK